MGAIVKTLATKNEMAKDFGAIRKEMADIKTETIKWMFIFWIGQVAVMLAMVLLYLKN